MGVIFTSTSVVIAIHTLYDVAVVSMPGLT
jgi:hypothetical protein